MGGSLKQRWIDPFLIPVAVVAVTVGLIVAMGESLLSIFEPGDTPDRLNRPELWYALVLALVVIGAGAFLVSRPKGTTGPLEKEVAIGDRPFFTDPLPPVDVRARTGPLGAVKDIEPGYTLFAQSGALATVEGILPGSDDWGKRFAGFMYARGMRGASDELWIPVEAVMSVYPETKSAFLAIKGDETEVFGWNVPPESVRRGPVRGAHEL